MTPQAFAADLATIPAMDDLTVRICSGGGDVWAAQAIGAMLENRLGTVTAQIEGICASAATIVASHCKVVKAAEDATYMIHPIKVNPNGFVDMEGLKQLMDALTVMRTNVLNQYAKKTGHTVEEVAAWMDATSWWTAAEAKENGFIDEITESNQTAKIENRNGALFVNSIAVPGTFDDAPEFVRNRAVVAPATTEGFVNNTDPAGKPDKNDGGNDMEFKNADELRNGCPDLVKEIVDEAHAEAQKQERDRLAAIDEIADAVPSDLVAEAKYGDKACSAEQLAYRAALDAKKKGHKLLDDTVPDWVPALGGKQFGFNLKEVAMPAFANGGFTHGVSIAGEAGTEAVISFKPSVHDSNVENWVRAGRMLGVSGEDATRAAGVRYFANGGFTDGSKEKLDNLIDFSKAYGKYALRSNGIRTTGDALSMLWTVANNSMSGDASLALAATSLAADVAPLLLNKYLGSDSPVTIALTEAAKNYNGGTVLSSWQDGVLTDTGTPLYVLPPRDTGRTLSEIPVSAYQNTPVPGGNGGSSPQFVFAPNITITGDADRQQIASIMEDEYEKFKAFMDKYNRENNRTRYA